MAGALLDPKVAVGSQPTGVAVSATRAYVANQGSNTVSVVDLTLSPPVVVATVAVGGQPWRGARTVRESMQRISVAAR